jgi:hypothetical protein
MEKVLIAPCGMNCGICSGYLALKNNVKSKGVRMSYCAGCHPRGKQCAFLKKRCAKLMNGKVQYCYECDEFPCHSLEHIDNRYRVLFKMSMVENLKYIKENGIAKLLEREEEKWKCPDCGGAICCHNGICFSCGLEKLKNKKKLYRWTDD